MTTTVTHTVIPAGGGDYTSINAWYAGIANKNLVLLDKIEEAVVSGGGNSLSAKMNFNSGATDSTRYYSVRAAVGAEFDGQWDATRAYLYLSNDNPIYSEMDVHFDGLYIKNPWTSSTFQYSVINTYNARMTVRNCGIRTTGTAIVYCFDLSSAGPHVFENTMFYAYSSTAGWYAGALWASGSATMNDCTAISLADNGFGVRIMAAGSVITTQNCYFKTTAGMSYWNSGGGTFNKGTHDATSNTDAVTPALRNIAFNSTNFTNVTLGSEDLHLPAGSALIGVGTPIGGISFDFEGDPRHVTTPCIGADEIVYTQTYSVNAADGLLLSDLPARAFLVAALENIVLTDSNTRLRTAPVVASEELLLSDVDVSLAHFFAAAAEGLVLSDLPARAFLAAALEGLVLSDLPTRAFSATAAEGLVLSDADVSLAHFFAAAMEGLILTDSGTRLRTVPGAASEGLVLSDLPARAFLAAALETIILVDVCTRLRGTSAAVSEEMLLSDASARLRRTFSAAAEGLLLADSSNRIRTVPSAALEGIIFSDLLRRAVPGAVVDSLVLSDVPARLRQTFSAALEGLVLSDSSTRLRRTFAAALEGLVLSDANTRLRRTFAAALENIILADVPSSLRTTFAAALEGLVFSDHVRRAFLALAAEGMVLSDSIPLTGGGFAAWASEGLVLSDGILGGIKILTDFLLVSAKGRSPFVTAQEGPATVLVSVRYPTVVVTVR